MESMLRPVLQTRTTRCWPRTDAATPAERNGRRFQFRDSIAQECFESCCDLPE